MDCSIEDLQTYANVPVGSQLALFGSRCSFMAGGEAHFPIEMGGKHLAGMTMFKIMFE